ncbi:MAG: HAMP domain-containing histidine kinase [Gammaproteobacteria bacterium]|nr:HAMP domain-containing histidine kinase [Gammaproteobacteria bacterium]
MNAILGYAQLLARDESLTSAQRRSLEIIDRSGEHLIELINDVLEMSRIEAGHATVQVDDIDLNDLLESLVAVFGYRASSKQLELSLDIDPDVPSAVRTDGGKLREILLNLISNAIKFTHPGGFVRVKAEVPEAGGAQLKLRFVVEDSGIGIAAQNVNRIFDAFHRAQDADRVIEGTGLGLTISQRYAELLGGGLTVQSEPGAGSRFQLDITVERGNPERIEAGPIRARTLRWPRDSGRSRCWWSTTTRSTACTCRDCWRPSGSRRGARRTGPKPLKRSSSGSRT